MTKPNNFQINSDYLSFGLTGSIDRNINVPAGKLQNGGYVWSTNINVPAQNGAIDTAQLTFNGETMCGTAFYINPSNVAAEVDVYRSSPSVVTLTVRFYGVTGNNADGSWSAFTLGLHIDSFKPPNGA